MCGPDCTEKLQTALRDAQAQRDEALKVYRQWEGAVAMLKRLLPLFEPKPDSEAKDT